MKASKARLLSEAEARRKDKPQELAAKKMQTVTEETREPEPATAADDFKIDYRAAARDALSRVQQELVTKEIEQIAAANRGAIYVAGRTPITILHMRGRDLWMSFLVVENLDDADQFILGRDFVRNFDVMVDLNNGLIRIRNHVKRPINRIIQTKIRYHFFWIEK